MAACSCLLMLGLGVLAVERACATLSRMLSTAALSRTQTEFGFYLLDDFSEGDFSWE